MKMENFVKSFFNGCWSLIKQLYEFFIEMIEKLTWRWVGSLVCFVVKSSVVAVLAYATVCIAESCYRTVCRMYDRLTCDYSRGSKSLSNDIVLTDCYGDGYNIYTKKTGKVLVSDVDWVTMSADGDSLAVIAKDGKRGYVNRFTGEIVIPIDYDRAWVFSDGVAAVEKDADLMFIDHSGKVIIGPGNSLGLNPDEKVFHGGLCILTDADTKKKGIIDRTGKWVLAPEYDDVKLSHGLYEVRKCGRVGVMSAAMDTLVTVDKTRVDIWEEYIDVVYADNTKKMFDRKGNLLVDFVVDYFEVLRYETDDIADDVYGKKDGKIATCMSYSVENREGLMDAKGRPITKPIFSRIEAISKDLYMCSPYGVYNSKGQLVSGKIVKQP